MSPTGNGGRICRVPSSAQHCEARSTPQHLNKKLHMGSGTPWAANLETHRHITSLRTPHSCTASGGPQLPPHPHIRHVHPNIHAQNRGRFEGGVCVLVLGWWRRGWGMLVMSATQIRYSSVQESLSGRTHDATTSTSFQIHHPPLYAPWRVTRRIQCTGRCARDACHVNSISGLP